EPAFPDQRLKYRDFLAGMRITECERLRVSFEGFALLNDLLSERMPQAIQVGVFDVLPNAVRAGVNLLAGKGILDERESCFSILELGVRLKIEARQFPEPLIELAFDLIALTIIDPQLLMYLFIKIFKELLASLLNALVNLYLHLLL